MLNSQSVYGFEDDLLTIYDVQQPKGKEHIFLMSMDRSGIIEGDYSKISKMFIPYVAGGDIYLDDADGTCGHPVCRGGKGRSRLNTNGLSQFPF